MAQVQDLAQEIPHAMGVAKKKKLVDLENVFFIVIFSSLFSCSLKIFSKCCLEYLLSEYFSVQCFI